MCAPLGIPWTQELGIQPAGVAANDSDGASASVRLPPTNATRVPVESIWAQQGGTAPFTATKSYRPARLAEHRRPIRLGGREWSGSALLRPNRLYRDAGRF